MKSTISDSRLYTDEMGVWRDDGSRTKMIIAWDEIHQVTGYLIDGITTCHFCVDIDWSYGAHCELHAESNGFADVVREIGLKLCEQGDWETRLRTLKRGDQPIVFWRRYVH